MILDTVISIQRLTKDLIDADKEKYESNLALSSVKCQIQPASPEETAIASGVFAQTFICFTTESGIRPGDKVTVSGTSEVFRVRGIEDWSMPDVSPHYELTMVRFEEEEIV
jgi:hypothetical protein